MHDGLEFAGSCYRGSEVNARIWEWALVLHLHLEFKLEKKCSKLIESSDESGEQK